jgi:hypothetical protein
MDVYISRSLLMNTSKLNKMLTPPAKVSYHGHPSRSHEHCGSYLRESLTLVKHRLNAHNVTFNNATSSEFPKRCSSEENQGVGPQEIGSDAAQLSFSRFPPR